MNERIVVGGHRPYDVVVGRSLVDELPPMLAEARTVAVVHSAAHPALAEPIKQALVEKGFTPVDLAVPDGEAAKTLATAERCYSELAAAKLTRSDAVVSVGGGAVTDLAGFVAATWLRGVAIVHVPTTLLGMVDAAVGGKTGVNTAAGKNLVGAFHPPAGVLCDLDYLQTLPTPDHAAGLAEVVKAGFISDPTILELIERDPRTALDPQAPVVAELISRSIRVKAKVVSTDLRESGPREALNYGHTLGHAIERVEDYTWRHGDAVSVGLCYAAEVGRLTHRLDGETATRHSAVLASLGLPTRYNGAPFNALLDVMRGDKKSRGDRLRFVVLDGLGKPGILDDPDQALLEQAFAAVAG